MMPMGKGVPDARPSLRFFTLSCLCFAVLGVVLPQAARYAGSFRHNADLLTAVHAFTLGLTALEMGAMYQLVPVLLNRPPAHRSQAALQPLVLAAGIALLLGGFFWWWPSLLMAGGLLVVAAAVWFAALIVPDIFRALDQGLIPAYLLGAVVSLLLVTGLGTTMAFNLRLGFLPSGAFPALGAHLTLGAGGWFGLAIIGVGYRLAGMFYFTPRGEPPRWTRILAWMTVLVVGTLATLLLFDRADLAPPLAVAAAGLGALYGVDFGRRLLRRQRRIVDPTLVHMLAGVAALLLACGILVAIALTDAFGARGWILLAILLLPGWAGNMAFGLAYKILPFLVWYRRFAPLVGQQPVPTLAQLLPRYLPWAGLTLWNAGLYGLMMAVSVGAGPAAGTAAGLLAGAGALAFAISGLKVLILRSRGE